MKRTISLALTLAVLFGILISCAPSASTKPPFSEEPTKSSSATLGLTEEPPPPSSSAQSGLSVCGWPITPGSLPRDLSFGGETVNIYLDPAYREEFIADQYTDVLLNDMVYDRNCAVKENYEVNLNFILSPFASGSEEFAREVSRAVSAGTNDYDLVIGASELLNSRVQRGDYANLYDLPYLDLKNEWWDQSYVREASLSDRLYTVTGALSHSAASRLSCVFFDYQNVETWLRDCGGADELYRMVEEGRWTVDALADWIKGQFTEVDGDMVPSDDDVYGLVVDSSDSFLLDALSFGMGSRITERNENGAPCLSLGSPRNGEIVGKLNALLASKDVKTSAAQESFLKGRAFFYCTTADFFSRLFDGKRPFGILPMPKLSEEQESYYSLRRGSYSVVAVPAGIEVSDRAEIAGATLEALGERSHRSSTALDRYYENATCSFLGYGRYDQQKGQVWKRIVEGAVSDFGHLYSLALNDPSSVLADGIRNGGDYAAAWAQKEQELLPKFNDLLAFFSRK